MSLDKTVNILAIVTLLEMMVTIGLGVSIEDVIAVIRSRRLMVKAAVVNYVVVPAATLGLLLIFRAQPMVAAGLLVAAVCPGAPYGPPLTALARGRVVVSIGLMVILAGSSAVVAPVLLRLLLPIVAGRDTPQVNIAQLVGTLLMSQFLPLCVGLIVRRQRPELAEKLKGPFVQLSKVLNICLIGLILVVQFKMLVSIRPLAYVGMLMLVGVAFLAGWLAAAADKEFRKALSITTSVRNVGVGLVIATGSFAGTSAVSAVTVYAVVQTIVIAVVATTWGRSSSSREPQATCGPHVIR